MVLDGTVRVHERDCRKTLQQFSFNFFVVVSSCCCIYCICNYI